MSEDIRLSDQQYQMVQVLNYLEEGSAKQVQAQLSHLGLAHTTIATVLTRLEKRGVLSSKVIGRERVYHCTVDVGEIRESMISSLVTTLFKGDSKALMTHLVTKGEINSDELDELRKIVKGEKSND